MNQPRVILADEPTGNLDEHTGDAVIDVLLGACAEQGAALVLVTHNPQHAAKCDRRLRLHDGVLGGGLGFLRLGFLSSEFSDSQRLHSELRDKHGRHPKPRTHEPETGAAPARVRCGVAGVGSLGQHHARIYASLPAAELAGIYETDDARAAAICAQYHCRRFATLEELGAACDAVSVVVPTDRHAAVALPLLARGCHLLIEKPLCASLAEAGQVLAAAQKHHRLVQVGHVEHFNPVMSFLEKEVAHPGYITAERLAPYQMRGTEVGVVLDLMIHDIGIVLALVKAPIRASTAWGSTCCRRPRTSPTPASSSRTAAWPT